jgi:hypothetical protein
LTSPKTSKRKRRALSPVEAATKVSPSKSKKSKRKLEFERRQRIKEKLQQQMS